jgi:hypothetical protein
VYNILSLGLLFEPKLHKFFLIIASDPIVIGIVKAKYIKHNIDGTVSSLLKNQQNITSKADEIIYCK